MILILQAEASAYVLLGNQGKRYVRQDQDLLSKKKLKKIFLDKVSKISETMNPADPFDPNSFAGAIVNSEQLEKINKYVNIGKEEGCAEIKVGGNITMKETEDVI